MRTKSTSSPFFFPCSIYIVERNLKFNFLMIEWRINHTILLSQSLKVTVDIIGRDARVGALQLEQQWSGNLGRPFKWTWGHMIIILSKIEELPQCCQPFFVLQTKSTSTWWWNGHIKYFTYLNLQESWRRNAFLFFGAYFSMSCFLTFFPSSLPLQSSIKHQIF